MDSRLDAFLKTRSSCQCLEIFLRPSSGLFRETHRNDWHVGRAETSLRVFKRALCRRRSVPAVVVNPAGTGQFHSREPGSLAQRRGSAAGISANAREQQSTQIASNRPSRQTRRNNIRGQRIPPKRGGHCRPTRTPPRSAEALRRSALRRRPLQLATAARDHLRRINCT
jgi:hypothetical protein